MQYEWLWLVWRVGGHEVMKRLLLVLLLCLVALPALAGDLPKRMDGANFYLEVAKGNVAGHSGIEIAGENTDLPNTGVFEDVWDGGGVYVPPTQARLHNISSSLAADAGTVLSSGTMTSGTFTTIFHEGATFSTDTVAIGDLALNSDNVEFGRITGVTEETLTIVGGMRDPDGGEMGEANSAGDAYRIVTDASTGASIVWMGGLSAFFLEQQEFVVLNGATDVSTTKSYVRMHLARAFGGASTEVAGNIEAETIGEVAETITWLILNGNNQTLMAIYTVPVDKTGYIVNWWSSMSRETASAASHVHLRAGTLNGFKYSVQPRAINTVGNSSLNYPYVIPRAIPGGSDIWVEANSNANSVGVSAGFEIMLVDN